MPIVNLKITYVKSKSRLANAQLKAGARHSFITEMAVFNPRHSSIVDVIHVPCSDVIDSYLHLNGFIRVEHKWSETNYFTVRESLGRS